VSSITVEAPKQLSPPAHRRTQSLSMMRVREAIWGYLFIAPSLLGFTVFIALPMIHSLILSFHSWNVFTPPQFVGLANYEALLQDSRLLASFRNTLVFVAIVVTFDVLIALALALALQRRLPGTLRYFFRTAFILPVVTSMSAIAIVLSFMLNTNLGVVNYYLGQLGFDKIPWLTSSAWALISISLATIWKTFGFDLLLFIAGLQNIPAHYYEAAEIDGANGWQKFRHITLPQLSSTIFFVVVISIISHLQVFDQAQIMTQGGPGDASSTIVMVIWESLGALRLGYGSTIATVFFLLIMCLTVVQFWLSRRWVYYEGGNES
jgi:multiple sugar transport system permease protein